MARARAIASLAGIVRRRARATASPPAVARGRADAVAAFRAVARARADAVAAFRAVARARADAVAASRAVARARAGAVAAFRAVARGRARAIACLAPIVLVAAVAPGAGAQVQSARTLDDNPIGAPQLGASAAGYAVVGWVGFAERRGAGGRLLGEDAILAVERDPIGRVRAARRISPPGATSRAFALAVGSAGDAAFVFRRVVRPARRAGGPLLVVRRAAGGRFSGAAAIPGSARGRQPAAAIGPDGTLLVAWLAPGRRGCGSVVSAALARRGRPFGAPRRVSGACPHAATPRAALGAGAEGAVAWRGGVPRGYARNAFTIAVAPFAGGRARRAATATRGPAVAGALDLAAARDGRSLLVWRDQASVSRAGARGRVLAATVGPGGPSAPVALSVSDRVVGPVRAAVAPSGATVVAWEEGSGRQPAVAIARRADGAAAFAAPETVDPCGAIDASRTGAFPALSADGRVALAFQSACMHRFGGGPDYGLAVVRAPTAGAFGAATPLTTGTYAVGVRLVLPATGPALAAWVERGTGLRFAEL